MMRTVAVIQARMSSTRLPGKVLMDFGGVSALGQLVRRAAAADGVDEVVVATSVESSDDPVVAECVRLDTRCVRGSLNNVLERFCTVFDEVSADVAVRLTADCPLHDSAVIARGIQTFTHGGVDYVTNGDERTYPDGLDVEVFSVDALRAAQRGETSPYEREHVTPWVRRHRTKRSFVQQEDLSVLRWTLDLPADRDFIVAAIEACGAACQASDVYAWLIENPTSLYVSPGTAEAVERDLVRRMRAVIGEGKKTSQ